MNYLFENIIAARNNKPEEGAWIQVIVIAVFIVFSVIKTILKAKSGEPRNQSKQDSHLPKTRAVPKRYVPDDGYKTLEQMREERKAQIRAAFGIPTPPEERKLVTPPPQPARRIPAEKTQRPVHRAKAAGHYADFAPTQQKLPALSEPVLFTPSVAEGSNLEGVEGSLDMVQPGLQQVTRSHELHMEDKPVHPKISKTQTGKKQHSQTTLPKTDTDDIYKLLLSSPQDLRNAILYTEILGKPLALREI